jgi:HEAT repeat protein
VFLDLFDANAQELAISGAAALLVFALNSALHTVVGRKASDLDTGRSARRWTEVTTTVKAFMGGDDQAGRGMARYLRRSTTRDLVVDALADAARVNPGSASRLRNRPDDVAQLVNWVSTELDHTDPRRRAQAAEIAATLRLRSSRAALAIATDDPDATVRVAACRALAGIDPDAAFAALIRLVETDGTWAADLLAHVLQTGTIEQQSRFALVLSERMLTWAPNAAVVRLLANDDLLHNNAILVRALRAHEPDIQIRAAEAIRSVALDREHLPDAVDALMECLASKHEMLRLAAVRALGELAEQLPRDMVLVFAALLGDSSRLVRYGAAHSLASLPNATNVLLNIKHGPDPAAAEAASLALWQRESTSNAVGGAEQRVNATDIDIAALNIAALDIAALDIAALDIDTSTIDTSSNVTADP